MWDTFWKDRGAPWEHDPGPTPGGVALQLFAETPNYRGIGLRWSGKEEFRWHFGPMFYRGRINGGAHVLVVGQEGAQDESLSHRSFTGGTGGRMQHLLRHLGVTHSYLFLNTFVYPIFGQYDAGLRPLAQDHRSPIVQHRHALFDHVATANPLRLVVAVGAAAKESLATWIRAHGGTAEPDHLELAQAGAVLPGLRAVGVVHPGGAGKGGSVAAIIASFKAAAAHVGAWSLSDPGWLPVDPGATRSPADSFKYGASPVPFADLPYGMPWRLGFGSTSSNRRDGQTAIQLFSKAGKYNNTGVTLAYPSLGPGPQTGYAGEPGDLPYEPPRVHPTGFDPGPSASFARLLQGGEAGLPWPDFTALGLSAHPSFGFGPGYRGRATDVSVLVLADQASDDDLLLGRALCGEAGQRLQSLLAAAGVRRRYLVLRTLPVDMLAAAPAAVTAAVDHAAVRAVLREAMARVAPQAVLAMGAHAGRIATAVAPGGVPVVTAKAFGTAGWQADWQRAHHDLAALAFTRDGPAHTSWDGGTLEILRDDLAFGTLRWQGTSGDRAARATAHGAPSPDYVKIVMPTWASGSHATPLSPTQQAAVDSMKT